MVEEVAHKEFRAWFPGVDCRLGEARQVADAVDSCHPQALPPVPPRTARTLLGVEHCKLQPPALEMERGGMPGLARANNNNVCAGRFHPPMIVARAVPPLVLAQGHREDG